MATSKNLVKRILDFFYGGHRGITSTNKDFLLVVVTLIAATTFQAGVNPPGGVWQETIKDNHAKIVPHDESSDSAHHVAGRAVFAQHKPSFIVFLSCNTFAFSVSVHLILHLMVDCPFFREIFVATTGMLATYMSAIYEITPDDNRKFVLILFVIVSPYVIQVCLRLWEKLRGVEKKDLPSNISITNSDVILDSVEKV